MTVSEEVESTCVVRSNRKLSFAELEKRAERRRVNGTLKCKAVKDVDIWCSAAKVGGRPWKETGDDPIAR